MDNQRVENQKTAESEEFSVDRISENVIPEELMLKKKVSEERIREMRRILLPLGRWYQANRRDLPWRREKNPYHTWISEIMLQQTRVEAVKEYYTKFLLALPSVRDLACCPEDRLMKLWEGLGYYSRVRNMQKAAIQIMNDFGGKIPDDVKTLKTLKGIGDYTAGAIASIAFGKPQAAVDGNVLRVITRVLADPSDITRQKYRKEIEDGLTGAMKLELSGSTAENPITPGDFNQGMMDLGATICLPVGVPKCAECPLVKWCKAHEQGREMDFPVKSEKKPRRMENRTILVVRDGDRVLLNRRPEKGLLAGLYEFPNLEGSLSEEEALNKVKELGLPALYIRRLEDSRHIFSHIEWQMRGYEIRVGSFPDRLSVGADETSDKKAGAGLFFAEIDEIRRKYAVPSAYKAYADALNLNRAENAGSAGLQKR